MTMRAIGFLIALALASLPAAAQSRLNDTPADDAIIEGGQQFDEAVPEFEYAQDTDVRVEPSEAAAIAQDAVPGSMVLKVKLLSSGVYAVTLKSRGSVVRVMVSAEDGSIQ
jgi:uncharacterized membrane protein YkoI